jgi:hypothetical protein
MEGATTPAPAASAPNSAAGTENIAATGDGTATESTQAKPAEQSDDPEFDLGGEKLKRSEYKRLRELEAKRKEYDRAASLKFEESSKLHKEAKALIDGLAKDAKAALKKAGIDPIQWAEQTLAEALEENGLSPEQKRLRELEAKEAERAREAEEAEARKATEQETAAVSQLTDNIANDFLGVLKPKNLPADDLPEIVGRMAYRVEALIDAGVPIDLEAVAEETLERFYAAPKQRFAGLTDEQLLERYPEEAERFRKALLAKAQKQPTPSKPPATRPKPAASRRGLTMAELREQIDRNVGAQ